MTAERWWVRFGARWIARIDSVQGHLGLVFQGMTGVSITSGALKYFGATWAVGPFLAITAICLLAYAYLYSEGGVWNQVSRDKNDMSTNFSGPNMLIDDILIATGVYAAIHGRPPDEEEQEALRSAVKGEWNQYRNGANLNPNGGSAK